MTREELKEHCKKQIEMCEMWAKAKGEKPCGKIYEEHKLTLELLEQESVLNKIRSEIEEHVKINQNLNTDRARALCWCLDVIDKYKAESCETKQGLAYADQDTMMPAT